MLAAIRYHGKPVAKEDGGDVGRHAEMNFVTAARPAADLVDMNRWKRTGFEPVPVQLVAGAHTPQSVRAADLGDNYVVYVPPAHLDSLQERAIVDALLETSRGVVVLDDEDSLTFARRLDAARRRPLRMVDHYMSGRMGVRSWGPYVWPPAVRDVFTSAGIDVAALRQAPQPVIEKMPAILLDLNVRPDTARGPSPTAPNVVAVLEGSDPKLKEEYVAFTAHMDTDPRGPRGENASGMAGLLALAKAFAAPAARPKRSLVFLATSGAAKDWWGARSFATRGGETYRIASHVVTSLHLDAIDQLVGDTVAVDGLEDFATAPSPRWVAASHPELGVTIVDGGSVDRSSSNLGAYLVRVRPSLAFHPSGGPTSDHGPASASIDAHSIVPLVRLMFYLGRDLAETDSRIGWSEIGRRRLRQATGGE